MEREFPCVLSADRCVNKQDNYWVCHGSLDLRCYINWASTDPEDVEPYEQYVAEVSRG